jgi:hypothetical protein
VSTVIKKIANYLVSQWSSLSASVKWAIEQVAGLTVIEAISKGVNAAIYALSKLSNWAIEKIASILGL